MKTKIAMTITATASLVVLSGCGMSYTFETEPLDGNMEGTYDNGYTGDPKSVNCVQIEADGPNDSDDVQMGTYCKEERGTQSDGEVDDNRDQGDD